MKLIIQHEYTNEISSLGYLRDKRNIELDALDFKLVDEKAMS